MDDEAKYLPFWVIPPLEGRLHDCPKPVTIQYTVKQDEKLPDNIKIIMEDCVKYYKEYDKELIDFDHTLNDESKIRFVDKMKLSLFPKFPKDEIETGGLWNWICELLNVEKEDPIKFPEEAIGKVRKRQEEAEQIQSLFIVPKTPPQLLEKDRLREQEKQRIKYEEEANRATLNAISCLQQQLSLPSGLNMTPSPISSSIVLPSTIKSSNNSKINNNISKTSTTTGQTVSTNQTSKMEVSIRATPSPAKSDHSQKSRSSPAQNQNRSSQNSSRPSSTSSSSSKFDLGFPGAAGLNANSLNDLYAATLASLASKLPPGLLPNDYAALLKSMPEYGLSALGALTASAAAYGNPGTSGVSNKRNSTSSPSQSTSGYPYGSYGSGSSSKSQSSNSYASLQKQSNSHKSSSGYSSHQHQQKQNSSGSNSNAGSNSRSSTNNSFAAAASASWLNQIPNMKEFMAQLEKGDLSVLMQSPYNIPSCKPSTSSSSKSEKNHNSNSSGGSLNSSSARTNYNMPPTSDQSKRKSSKNYDYDNYKSEAGKIADLMKSPEYTQMLLMQQAQAQAQAFRGLGSEITVTRKPSSTVTSQSVKKTSTATSATQSNPALSTSSILQNMPLMDLNSLAEMSKSIPELNALLNSNKPEDINALLQMQMLSKNTLDYSALFGNTKTNKAMQDYATALAAATASNPNLLSQYMLGSADLTSLFGPMSSLYGMGGLAG